MHRKHIRFRHYHAILECFDLDSNFTLLESGDTAHDDAELRTTAWNNEPMKNQYCMAADSGRLTRVG